MVVFRISKTVNSSRHRGSPMGFPPCGDNTITWSPMRSPEALRIQRQVLKSQDPMHRYGHLENFWCFFWMEGMTVSMYVNGITIVFFVLASAASLRTNGGLWDLSRGSLLRFVLCDTRKIYSRVSFCSCSLCCCWYCASVQEMHDCNSRICAHIIIAISYYWYEHI